MAGKSKKSVSTPGGVGGVRIQSALYGRIQAWQGLVEKDTDKRPTITGVIEAMEVLIDDRGLETEMLELLKRKWRDPNINDLREELQKMRIEKGNREKS